ncbi:MAG: SDR family NAD(P)-dependent oxidoreductase, partial [Candidatus Dadabacteria bacterium]
MAREGFGVVLVARRRERLERLARELEASYGVPSRVVVADLTRPEAARALAEAVGDIDVGLLVNNAGTGWIGRFDLQKPEYHAGLVDLHCRLPVELTARLLPRFLSRGRGGIVLVASAAAYVPLPYYAVYSGTKAFLATWGEALAVELEGTGVDVLVLSPGDTKTEFQEVAGE